MQVMHIREFVAACPTCAHSKSTTRATAGLLQPLSTPHRPWSHISIAFVTGLPPSDGDTTIVTVVDSFSKLVHFIPTEKLPSAKGTAELMLHQMFRLYGFPVEVVSDRESQFITHFWKVFCSLVGVTVSVSTGNPSTNQWAI